MCLSPTRCALAACVLPSDMPTKQCFKCLQHKPLEAFYRHSMMADGHLNKCKECTKADVAKYRHDNLESVREYDRMRGSIPHRVAARKEYAQSETGKNAHQRAMRAYRIKFPERAVARFAVNNAVRDGRLIPWPVCAVPECSQKPEAHHPDYSHPLDVVWLCDKHHKEAHAIERAERRKAA